MGTLKNSGRAPASETIPEAQARIESIENTLDEPTEFLSKRGLICRKQSLPRWKSLSLSLHTGLPIALGDTLVARSTHPVTLFVDDA